MTQDASRQQSEDSAKPSGSASAPDPGTATQEQTSTASLSDEGVGLESGTPNTFEPEEG